MNPTTLVVQRMRPLALAALALAALTTTAALAQTSVPTPQSVAPNYRPPQQATFNTASPSGLHFVAPHAGTWDFYITLGGLFSGNTNMSARNVRVDTNTFLDGRIKMKFDDSFTFGFGVGYNITEQLSVHGQFSFSSPDYDATFYPDRPVNDNQGNPIPAYRIRGSADISTGDLALRYDILPGKIRPYVQGSIGFMYIDTGIPNGQSYWVWDGGNWGWGGWGGWGGWYSATPTVTHTYFTLGATAGLNYYFTDRVFGGVSYTFNWANTPSKWMLNQRLGVSVGWNF